MNPQVVEKKNTNHLAKTVRPILAAKDDKSLPTRIEIIKAGEWPDDSNKGFMKITTADLLEFKANFDAGVGMPGGAGFGLPIDFSHEEWAAAAGWMKELTIEGDTLFAEVEWTKSGEDALTGGDFKCISPSFYPACLGSWHDPEDWSLTAQNVLVGAGLTNIPFFKGLSPIMASNASSEGSREDKNIIHVSASEKEKSMQLEDIRAKGADALTEDEKSFLTEHKEELTAEEQTKFGFEVTAEVQETEEQKQERLAAEAKAEEEAAAAAVTPELAAVQADLKSGKKVLVEASQLKRLEKVADEFESEKAAAFVQAHVARGAIKADQAEVWAKRIVADETMKKDLENLPSNDALAGEQGSSVKATETGSAIAQIKEKADALVKSSKEAGKPIDIGTAMSKVLADNKELAAEYAEEKKGTE